VSGQTKHINRAVLQIQRDFPDGLHRIGVKRNPTSPAKSPDFLNRENHTGFIVGIHNRDQGRIVIEHLCQLIQTQPALTVNGQFIDFIAVLFEMPAGT